MKELEKEENHTLKFKRPMDEDLYIRIIIVLYIITIIDLIYIATLV